jgi:hypothetical protein
MRRLRMMEFIQQLNPKILPSILMAIQMLSCLVYLAQGDWRRALYWASATALIYSVTF